MTSVSKNVYINNLADIVNKYSNTHQTTIKMKPVDVKKSIYIDYKKKVTLQIGLKKFLWLKRLKILFLGYMLLVIDFIKKLLEHFTKKLQKPNQKEFRVEKVIKRKGDKICVKWKDCNDYFKGTLMQIWKSSHIFKFLQK